MTRPTGRMVTSVVCLSLMTSVAGWYDDRQEQRKTTPVVGKGTVILPLPDLRVTGVQKPGYKCTSGTLAMIVQAQIRNDGPGPATLTSNWTKPWVTAYPSVAITGFVKPYQTGAKTVTLKPGEVESVDFDVTLPPAAGGAGYDLIFEVDPSNAIKESNEKNNTGTLTVPAKICQ